MEISLAPQQVIDEMLYLDTMSGFYESIEAFANDKNGFLIYGKVMYA